MLKVLLGQARLSRSFQQCARKLMSHKSLTVTGHQPGAQPRLQVLVLEALVDVGAAVKQGLHRLRFVEEDKGSHAHPDQIHVTQFFSPFYHLLE